MYCLPVTCDLPAKSNFISEQTLFLKACDYFKVTKEDLLSKKRDREFVIPRQIIMELLYSNTGYSLKAIGGIFFRDHTTVIHSKRTVNNLLFSDPYYRHRYNEFISTLGGSP